MESAPPVNEALIDWWVGDQRSNYGSAEASMATCCTKADVSAHPGMVGRYLSGAVVRKCLRSQRKQVRPAWPQVARWP